MEFNMKKIKVGMFVEGKVFMVTDDSVHIDLGAHAEGVIYKKGMALEEIKSCKDLVKEGDMITAKVNKIDDENQQILMSRLDFLHQEKRANFEEFIKGAAKFSAKVTKVTRGGLVMSYKGVELFLPASHVDFKRVELEDFKDKTLEVTVIENDGRKIVVSRRKALEKTTKRR